MNGIKFLVCGFTRWDYVALASDSADFSSTDIILLFSVQPPGIV